METAVPTDETDTAREVGRIVLLPVEEILSNRSQPRTYFDQQALLELSQSIAASGLLQPITVRKLPGGSLELVAGERRLMAYRALGRTHIPAIVETYSDTQSATFALIENLQRRDLNYFEEAAGIARLMREQGLTQQQVSRQLGKAQSTVANKLRLLRYPPALRERMLGAGLTERHARALLALPNPGDTAPLEHIIAHRLNVEQTERYVAALLEEQRPKPTRLVVIKDMRIFLNSIHKAVKIMQGAGIEVLSQKNETDTHVEMVIRVPKAAVYQRAINN